MPTQINCPNCEISLNLPDAAAGKKVRCTKCNTPFVAPAAEAVEVVPPPIAVTPIEPAPAPQQVAAPPNPTLSAGSPLLVRTGSRFSEKLRRADLLIFGGAMLCALAFFLPWVHIAIFSRKVYESDGLWACLAAVGGIVWAAVDFSNTKLSRGACITTLVGGGIALSIALFWLVRIASAGDEISDDPFGIGQALAESFSPGVGLVAILLGSAAMVVGALGVLLQKPGQPNNWFMTHLVARPEGG